MKYVGSKSRIAKQIIPILMDGHDQAKPYIEPFVGGANMIDKVPADIRVGIDSNPHLVALLQALRDGWAPPRLVTEEDYQRLKADPDSDPVMAAYAGFACSFGGKWFGGYARRYRDRLREETERLTSGEAYRNATRQAPLLAGIQFIQGDVFTLAPPAGSTIYCDPPYRNTMGYRGAGGFDHDRFWDTAKQWARARGCRVFVSENSAPDFAEVVWSATLRNEINKSKKRAERLYKIA